VTSASRTLVNRYNRSRGSLEVYFGFDRADCRRPETLTRGQGAPGSRPIVRLGGFTPEARATSIQPRPTTGGVHASRRPRLDAVQGVPWVVEAAEPHDQVGLAWSS